MFKNVETSVNSFLGNWTRNSGDEKVQGRQVEAAKRERSGSGSRVLVNKNNTQEFGIVMKLRERAISSSKSILSKELNSQINFEELPYKGKPLVESVYNFTKYGGSSQLFLPLAKNYFNEYEEKNLQQKTGIYRTDDAEKRNLMSPEHREVFIAILSNICNNKLDQKTQAVILMPIVDAIFESRKNIFYTTRINYHHMDVEPITRDFFNLAYFFTKKDDYLFYTVENRSETIQFIEQKAIIENEKQITKQIEEKKGNPFLTSLIYGFLLFLVFLTSYNFFSRS